MSTIVTRTGKGSTLTHVEVDANFTNLNTDKLEASAITNMLETTDIGVSVQAYSANLDEYATVNPTTAGLALLDDVDAAAQRTTLGLVIGTDVQAYTATGTASEITTGTETAIRTWAPDVLNDAIRTLAVPQSIISYTGTGGITSKGVGFATTGTIPGDGSAPQNTEGSAILDVTISPSAIGAVIEVEAVCYFNASNNNNNILALFTDDDASAVAVAIQYNSTNNAVNTLHLLYRMTASSTDAITFKVRGGATAASTLHWNRINTTTDYAGLMSSYIKATEVGYT